MKILLISSNSEMVPYPVMPIGLAFVASWLKKKGHEVRFLDLCFEKHPLAAVRKQIKSFSPETIGISMRNLDNCDYLKPKSFLAETQKVLEECRRNTGAPIVLGGSAVGVFPRAVFERLKPDYVLSGDGELSMGELVCCLENGIGPSEVGGVGYLHEGRWHFTPHSKSLSFHENVFPQIFEWVNVKPYLNYEGFYPLQTKRGCALKCIYCTYKNIEGESYRFNPASRVVDEIEEVLRAHPGVQFEFVDSTFNSPCSHAMNILRELKKRNVRARFVGSGLNPISAPRELFAAMRETGFRHLVCTPESASEKILLNLKKGFTRKHLQNVAESVRREKFQTLWIFLMGGPGERPETVEETLEFIHNDIGPKDVAYITSGLRIYPHTELSALAIKEKVIDSEEQLIEPTFYFSNELSREWLSGTLQEHSRRDLRIIRSVDAEHPWIPKMSKWIHRLGNQKPFWTYAPVFNRLLNWGRAWNNLI